MDVITEQNLTRKRQLLDELSALLSQKRRLKASSGLMPFIELYLSHLTTHASPAFHREMAELMTRLTREGGAAPTTKEEKNIIPPPHFSPTFSKQSSPSDLSPKTLPEPDSEPVPDAKFDPYKASKPSEAISGSSSQSSSQSPNFFSREFLNRLLVIAPRGFAKSTIASVAFPLWLALYGKRKDIFLVSATMSLAKEMLRKVRKELEGNAKIIEDFGEQHLSENKWTEDVVQLANGTMIRAKGRGFQIRGFRPDMIICDDLEDEEIIYSKEQRDKLETWFFRTLLPALKVDQSLMYVGTMIHQYSLMAKLRVKSEFETRFYKALTNVNGVSKSIWEEMWPTERLIQLKRELGTYAFEAEYQNNPISLTEQPVKPHYLERVKVEGTPLALCLAIDPAISEKEGSDERAFVLLGKFEKDEEITGFKEIYSEKGRWGVTEQIERIIRIYKDYSKFYKDVPFRIVVESVAFQKVFKDDLLKAARKEHLFLPVSEASLGVGENKVPRDKFTRLMSVVHLFEQRLVQLTNPDLIEEILAFPVGDADNMVDACVYSLQWLLSFRSGKIMKKVEQVKHVMGRPSYYVKEVRPGVYVSTIEEPPMPKMKGLVRFGL